VLRVLQGEDLYLKPEKCTFESTSVDYLGLVVSPGKVEMDPVKLAGIKDWPMPKSVRDIR
jgi:hypothetical protein